MVFYLGHVIILGTAIALLTLHFLNPLLLSQQAEFHEMIFTFITEP